MNTTTDRLITPHEFNRAADAFYNHRYDPALNEQGNRREKLRAAFVELGIVPAPPKGTPNE